MSQEQLRMANNVQLVRRLADGGACFCTRDAMQGYDVVLFILAMAKTPDKPGQAVTPVGVP
jgi:hypothetical protein